MKSKIFFLFLFIFIMIGTVSAQKTWEKPMQKWNKDDAIKILNVSPWVQTYQSTEALAALDKAQMSETQSNLRINGSTPQQKVNGSTSRTLNVAPIIIRLHSSLLIRQALVRLQQIEKGYDKMDNETKANFDNSMKSILECPICKNYYVITMTKAIATSSENVEDGILQTMTNEQVKGNVWLVSDNGNKLELEQFVPPKGAKDLALFFFKRKDSNGNNFLTPEDKSFKFVFNNTFLGSNNPYASLLPKEIEFKISNLVVDGNLIF